MKKIILSSILTLLLSVSLFAKEPFIQVMSISDLNNLNSAKSSINKLGYKTYISKKGKWHIIYAGPFRNTKEANKALVAVKKHVSKDAFLTKVKVPKPKKIVKKYITPIQKKVAVPSVKIQEKKEAVKKVVAVKITPTKQTTTVTSVDKIIPIKKQPTLSSTPKEDVISEITIQEKTEITPIQRAVESKEEQEKGIYIALAAGYSLMGVTKDDISGNVTLNYELKDSGINYGAEIGYYFNNNIFISIDYQKTDLKDVSLNNAFTTLNYQFDEMYSFSPYIGAIAGYSTITWEKEPIDFATGKTSASSILGGLQVGSDISLYGGVSLSIFYRYLMMNNITNIETGTGKSKIEHNSEQNLNVGIKYNF